jgi:hypothetical protein
MCIVVTLCIAYVTNIEACERCQLVSVMAFPIPSHLPRKSNNVQDVSSKILSKLDEATNQTLNAAMTTSWIVELDETILLTKVYIIAPIFMPTLSLEYAFLFYPESHP